MARFAGLFVLALAAWHPLIQVLVPLYISVLQLVRVVGSNEDKNSCGDVLFLSSLYCYYTACV